MSISHRQDTPEHVVEKVLRRVEVAKVSAGPDTQLLHN